MGTVGGRASSYRWFRKGTLVVAAVRVNSRTVLVNPGGGDAPTCGVGLYARVCSHDQHADFDQRVARLNEWAAKANASVVRVEVEFGSGMNGARLKVRRRWVGWTTKRTPRGARSVNRRSPQCRHRGGLGRSPAR